MDWLCRVFFRDPFRANHLFSTFCVCTKFKCSIRKINRLQHTLTDLPLTPAEIQHFLLGCGNKNSRVIQEWDKTNKQKNFRSFFRSGNRKLFRYFPSTPHTPFVLAPFVVQKQSRDTGGDAGFSLPNFPQQLLPPSLLDLLLLSDTLLYTLLLLKYRNTRIIWENYIFQK